MRIALVSRVYPTQRPGGLPFVVQDRAQALAALGHEVHVVTTTGAGALDEAVVIHEGGDPVVYSKAFAEHCRAAVRTLNPDVVHLDSFDRERPWWEGLHYNVSVTMHGFGAGAALTAWTRCIAGGLSPAKIRIPTVQDLTNEAAALRSFYRVLAISLHERWLLEAAYALSNVRLVYNPIAPYFFDYTKGPAPRDGSFVCIGNPGTSGNRNFSAAVGHGHDVVVYTDTPRTSLPSAYAGARALLLPTFWQQGYDLTVAEALACRRPVIAAYVGSYSRQESPHIHTFPAGAWRSMRELMQTDLPEVPVDAADRHRPENHAKAWLEAVT